MRENDIDGISRFDCFVETCDRTFDTEQGVQTHISRSKEADHQRGFTELKIEQKYGVPYEWLLETLYVILEKPVPEISRDIGLGETTLYRALENYGLDRRSMSEVRSLVVGPQPDPRDQYLPTDFTDYTTPGIECPIDGCDAVFENTLGMGVHFDKGEKDVPHGKDCMTMLLEQRFDVPAKWLLETLYHVFERSARRVSQDLGIGYSTVYRLMDHHDIEHRSVPEGLSLRPIEQTPMYGRTGPDHPRWKGGTSLYHSLLRSMDRQWWVASRETRENSMSCEMCPHGPEDSGRKLDVHHIIPVLAGGTSGDYNLITLCRSCHRKADAYIWQFAERVFAPDGSQDTTSDSQVTFDLFA